MRLYLAGAEGCFAFALHCVQYPFRLCSYFYLRESGLENEMFRYVDDGSHWIMDSGLYSYMFGSERGKLTTFEDYRAYTKKYVDTVREWKWKHAIVECDVQKVLSVRDTHRLRAEFFEPFEAEGQCEVIYVWHIPEGEAGLRAMAKKYKYIALSVPELRRETSEGKRLMLLRLLRIVNESGNPKVHLLGNTENKLSKLPAFSGDSTSWKGSDRWGKATLFDTRDRSPRVVSPYSPKWRAWRRLAEAQHPEGFKMLEQLCLEKGISWDLRNIAASAFGYRVFMETINGRPEEPTQLYPGRASRDQGRADRSPDEAHRT